MTTTTVNFSISGEFITQHVRNLTVEGSWNKAFQILMDDMGGMEYEWAMDILAGKRKLVGVDDNITLADDDDTDYKSNLNYMYGSIYEHNNFSYTPVREVVSWGSDDMYSVPSELSVLLRETDIVELSAERSKYYLHENEILRTIKVDKKRKQIIFKQVAGVPSFITPYNTPEDAYSQAIESGKVIYPDGWSEDKGDHCDYTSDDINTNVYNLDGNIVKERPSDEELEQQEKEEHEKWLDRIANLRKDIIAQADSGIGWFDLHVPINNKTYRIPKAPFIHWMQADTLMRNNMNEAGIVTPEWKQVCESGMKMYNDNPYHSDWFIGAGMDPQDSYGGFGPDELYEGQMLNNAAFSHMYKVIHQDLDMDAVPLVRNGKATGKIVHPKPNEQVEPGSIIVIPSAGPDYYIPAQTAHSNGRGAIITQTGGKLCHLATVGRESGFRMVMVPDALGEYLPGMLVEVDTENGSIKQKDIM